MAVRRLMLALVLTASWVGAVSAPVRAQSTGAIEFSCTARISGGLAGSAACGNGEVPATAVASFTGISNEGNPYVVAGPGGFSGSWFLSDACLGSVPFPLATAQGTMTVTGVPSVHKGEAATASITFTFTWTRAGGEALMTVTSASLWFSNGGSDNPVLGAGSAEHVSVPYNRCPSGGPASAAITGRVAVGG